MKKLITIFSVFFIKAAVACSGVGVITDTGTIIAKNRDYFYIPQTFGLMKPLPSFSNWYDNSYHHYNKFYAITSAESISMGVNSAGLSAIEEDSLGDDRGGNAAAYKTLQEKSGVPDGLILYGVLQNFNSIDEMVPYLSKIFDHAAPDYYQFSDSKKILTIEVSRKEYPVSSKHTFTYQILDKQGERFIHTNTYLSPEFTFLNNFIASQDSLVSSNTRFQQLTEYLANAKIKNINEIVKWLSDTHSSVSTKEYTCQNTSIFRSDLKGQVSINMTNKSNNKLFGTVASMVISNNSNFNHSYIYVRMLDSITVKNNGDQLIRYQVLQTSLANLFGNKKLSFVKYEVTRKAPLNGVCI